MSFLKGLGQFAGEVTGKVLGGTVRVVGEITGSQYINDIGNAVEKATIITGTTAGQLASGAFDVAKGVIQQDGDVVDNGLGDIGGAITNTARGVVSSAKFVYGSGKDIVEGIKDDDIEKMKHGAKGLVAAAAISVLAVGIIDVIDGADGLESIDYTADGGIDGDLVESEIQTSMDPIHESSIENPNTHHVDSHYVEGYTREDGTSVEGYYRDGDGDTSINNPNGGYEQHNPNYKA